ncbi:MAG: DUF3301 domain-containing protein [Pseudomonadales bacterium]|nr:DUF3301 domain-containing protein [Pseudomonadales bacterium]
MLDLNDVFILFVVMLVIYAFYHMALLRERAYKAVANHCKIKNLQLLDQNVAVKALWFKRDDHGSLRFWLTCEFEFSSTGDERYSGKIVILGGKIVNIILPPYRVPDTQGDD